MPALAHDDPSTAVVRVAFDLGIVAAAEHSSPAPESLALLPFVNRITVRGFAGALVVNGEAATRSGVPVAKVLPGCCGFFPAVADAAPPPAPILLMRGLKSEQSTKALTGDIYELGHGGPSSRFAGQVACRMPPASGRRAP